MVCSWTGALFIGIHYRIIYRGLCDESFWFCVECDYKCHINWALTLLESLLSPIFFRGMIILYRSLIWCMAMNVIKSNDQSLKGGLLLIRHISYFFNHKLFLILLRGEQQEGCCLCPSLGIKSLVPIRLNEYWPHLRIVLIKFISVLH